MVADEIDKTEFASRKFEWCKFVRRAGKLPSSTICLAIALVDHFDRRYRGVATVSVRELANDINLSSENPVREALRHLAAVGLITVEWSSGGFGKPHRIEMRFPLDLDDQIAAWAKEWAAEKRQKVEAKKDRAQRRKATMAQNPSDMSEPFYASDIAEGFSEEEPASCPAGSEGFYPSDIAEGETLQICLNPHSIPVDPEESGSEIGPDGAVPGDRLRPASNAGEDLPTESLVHDVSDAGPRAAPRIPLRVGPFDPEEFREIFDELWTMRPWSDDEASSRLELARTLQHVDASNLVAELQAQPCMTPSSFIGWLRTKRRAA